MTYVENNLIEELHGVAQEHEGDNVPIDLVSQLGKIHFLNTLSISMLVEELPSGIDISDTGCGREKSSGVRIIAGRRRTSVPDIGVFGLFIDVRRHGGNASSSSETLIGDAEGKDNEFEGMNYKGNKKAVLSRELRQAQKMATERKLRKRHGKKADARNGLAGGRLCR